MTDLAKLPSICGATSISLEKHIHSTGSIYVHTPMITFISGCGAVIFLLIPFLAMIARIVVEQQAHPQKYDDYQITPIHEEQGFGSGAIIENIDLCQIAEDEDAMDNVISVLTADLFENEFLILKRQCVDNDYVVPAELLTDLASRFGNITVGLTETDDFDPNEFINAISNDPDHNNTFVGSFGWHIDGPFSEPNHVVLQHTVSHPIEGYGGTLLVSSQKLLQFLAEHDSALWEKLNRLYMLIPEHSLGAGKWQHISPIIARHPVTGKEYIGIHTGNIPRKTRIVEVLDEDDIPEFDALCIENENAFFSQRHGGDSLPWNGQDQRFKLLSAKETRKVVEAVGEFIDTKWTKNGVIYDVPEEEGDLLIRDNLALLHRGPMRREKLEPVEEVGLRIVWRITTEAIQFSSKFVQE